MTSNLVIKKEGKQNIVTYNYQVQANDTRAESDTLKRKGASWDSIEKRAVLGHYLPFLVSFRHKKWEMVPTRVPPTGFATVIIHYMPYVVWQ